MDAAARPKRKWSQFNLKVFLLAFTVIAVWLGCNLHKVRQRDSVRAYLESQGAQITLVADIPEPDPITVGLTSVEHPWTVSQMPWMWRLLGAEPVHRIGLSDPTFNRADARMVEKLFPEADVDLDTRPLFN